MDNNDLIRNVLEGIYKDDKLRKTVIPCFLSNPGLNKSTTIREFAKEKGVGLVPLVLSQRNPNEISGCLLPDDGQMKYFDYDLLANMKDGDILFVDEVLNANAMVLNACLTILMERELISGKKLADIMIVAASNPQGATRLTPQQKQRFVFYNLELDEGNFQQHLEKKYLMPKSISQTIIKVIKEESFTSKQYNYNSARSLDTAVDMMIKGVITPYGVLIEKALNFKIENTSDTDIILNNGKKFLKNEKLPWLTLKQSEYEINH